MPTQPADGRSLKDTASADATVWRWQQRARQWLDFPLGRFLDFGCGRGVLADNVAHRCTEWHGVDVNKHVVQDAQARYAGHTFCTIDRSGRTPYPDDFFDTVAIVEVIEHVPDERRTLAEIGRILRPGGTLILTTPHKGILTFLDPGNFKFLLPALHRFVHVRILRNRRYYHERFVRTKDFGLVGDISAASNRRSWHRHYRPGEIAVFCSPHMVLEKYAVYFPAMRAFMLLQGVLRVLTAGFVKRIPWPLSALERHLSRIESQFGDQLVMRFTKKVQSL